MKTLVCVGALCVMLSGLSAARADGLRCGTRLVSTGDSTYLVQARCGQPDDATTWVEYSSVRVKEGNLWVERTVEVKYERWTYDFGTNRLIRYVVFENGRLIRVDTGPYGEKKSDS
ncbi:MAG: DUF2845 domain-containing protein [Deltaproteobacteria bacterium]|nr:DUF2845 domain-containing protein [Deltaproteobacteria bacterium]